MTFHGRVQTGLGVGRSLGFPTANLAQPTPLPPSVWGVYCCWVKMNGKPHAAVAHIGPARVVGRAKPQLEVHFLDWSGDLVGKQLSVTLVYQLRKTRDFIDRTALAQQIAADCTNAARFFQQQAAGGTFAPA